MIKKSDFILLQIASRYRFNAGKTAFIWLFQLAIIAVNTGCVSLPKNNSVRSLSVIAPPDAVLSQLASANTPSNPNESSFVFLSDGADAFVARMALASKAETSIDVQYYIWHNDVTGNLLVNELIKSAERGVRVRILVDDINFSSANDDALALLASYPTVSVRVFNPFNRKVDKVSQMVLRFGDITRRMHNKSFVVDGQVSILGGRNIGDEYFGANSQLEFADLDVLSIGPIVADVSSVYDLYWNNPLAYPIELLRPKMFDKQYIDKKREELFDFALEQQNSVYGDKVRASNFLKQLLEHKLSFFSGNVELIYDDPDKISSSRDQTELHLISKLAPKIHNIHKELLIITPYFVPKDKGLDFLLALEQKGVQVRVVTNSLASTDVSMVHAGYKNARKKLLKAGVELYEMKADPSALKMPNKTNFGSSRASLHAKTFAIDRETLFVGSLNVDPRSFTENTEMGMLIHSKEAAQILGEWFDSDLKDSVYTLSWDEQSSNIIWTDYNDGDVRKYSHDPDTSWLLRRWVDFLSLLPIKSQL
ncbi:phospholipase D-like domain-containing protein [Aliiglaciecola aliphaticivorans]